MDATNTATTIPGTEDIHEMYERIGARLTELVAKHKAQMTESKAAQKNLERKLNAQIKANEHELATIRQLQKKRARAEDDPAEEEPAEAPAAEAPAAEAPAAEAPAAEAPAPADGSNA